MDLLSPKSLRLLKKLAKKDLFKEKIDDQTISRLFELVELGYAKTGYIDHPSGREGGLLRVWQIDTPGMVYIQDYKDISALNAREKWIERVYGFVSGVALTVIAWLLSA